MRCRKLYLLCALLLIGAALLAGCASEPEEGQAEPTSAERPSHHEFVGQVEPICKELDDKLHMFKDPESFPAELKEYGGAAERYIESVQGEISQLADLTPPANLEEQWTEFTGALLESLDRAELTADLVAAKNDDTDALSNAWTSNKTARARAMELAAELGLEGCQSLLAMGGGH